VSRLIRSEPVRVYLGTLLTAVVAALAFYGVIEAEAVPVVLAVVTALLAVPTVEAARSKVTPVNRSDAAVAGSAGDIDER
jgi:hypothetical protein